MKTFLWSTALLLGTAAVVAAEPVEGFLTDYSAAQARAKKENKPLFLHFTTTWCSWCRKIENEIYKTDEGREILAPFVKASLDCTVGEGEEPSGEVQANLRRMQQYGGEGYPYLVMTAPDGERIGSISGYLPLPQFRAEIEKALKNWATLQKIRACRARGDTNSLEYHQQCLDFYLDTYSFFQAAQAAEAIVKLDPDGEKSDAAQIAYARFHAALVSEAPADKIDALRQAVAQTDPNNEKGYREQACLSQVMLLMIRGQKKSPAEQQEILRKMAEILEEMVQKIKPTHPLRVYGLLFQVQAKLGNFDAAIRSLEALKQSAPEGLDTARIDETIEKLRLEKQKQESAAAAGKSDAKKTTGAK